MGSESSKQSDVAGQANTNILVEQNDEKRIDIFHSVVLILLLCILVTQCAYFVFRQHQRRMKKRYLERASARQIRA